MLPFAEVLFDEVPFVMVLQFLPSNFSMKLTDLSIINYILCLLDPSNISRVINKDKHVYLEVNIFKFRINLVLSYK